MLCDPQHSHGSRRKSTEREQDIEDLKKEFNGLAMDIMGQISCSGNDAEERFNKLQEELRSSEDLLKRILAQLGHRDVNESELQELRRFNVTLMGDCQAQFMVIKRSLDVVMEQNRQIIDMLGTAFIHRSPVQVSKRRNLLVLVSSLDPSRVAFGSKIGAGAFGDVHIGEYNGKAVAYKFVRKVNGPLSDAEKEAVENEAILMRFAAHENVLYCHGVLHYPLYSVIVLARALASLADVLSDSEAYPVLPDLLRLCWFLDACTGLLHLHRMKILHKDLKGSNMLIMDNNTLVICDFGLSKISPSMMTQKSTVAGAGAGGTLAYMAPELWQRAKASPASDVFALGICLIESLSRSLPRIEDVAGQVQEALSTITSTSPLFPYVRDLESLMVAMLGAMDKRPTQCVLVCVRPG